MVAFEQGCEGVRRVPCAHQEEQHLGNGNSQCGVPRGKSTQCWSRRKEGEEQEINQGVVGWGRPQTEVVAGIKMVNQLTSR